MSGLVFPSLQWSVSSFLLTALRVACLDLALKLKPRGDVVSQSEDGTHLIRLISFSEGRDRKQRQI